VHPPFSLLAAEPPALWLLIWQYVFPVAAEEKENPFLCACLDTFTPFNLQVSEKE
jgi:hypothetical protein